MNLSPAAKKKKPPSKIHQKCKQDKIKDKVSQGELFSLWFSFGNQSDSLQLVHISLLSDKRMALCFQVPEGP